MDSLDSPSVPRCFVPIACPMELLRFWVANEKLCWPIFILIFLLTVRCCILFFFFGIWILGLEIEPCELRFQGSIYLRSKEKIQIPKPKKIT